MDKYTMGFKFRIYPNHAQQELINRTLGCCRFVFNPVLWAVADLCSIIFSPSVEMNGLQTISL